MTTRSSTPRSEDDKPAPQRRVLIVEDDEDCLNQLKTLIQLRGHTPECAGTGSDAFTILAGSTFDVGIIDLSLPGMTGHEFARAVRALYGRASPFLIAFSGLGGGNAEARALEAGFDCYLPKVCAPAVLLSAVEDGRMDSKGV